MAVDLALADASASDPLLDHTDDIMDTSKHISIVRDEEHNLAYSDEGEVVNASGHRDQLKRGFGLLNIIGLAVNVDVAWVVLATGLTINLST